MEQILRKLASGMTPEQILEDHPRLAIEDIQAVEAFAADYVAGAMKWMSRSFAGQGPQRAVIVQGQRLLAYGSDPGALMLDEVVRAHPKYLLLCSGCNRSFRHSAQPLATASSARRSRDALFQVGHFSLDSRIPAII